MVPPEREAEAKGRPPLDGMRRSVLHWMTSMVSSRQTPRRRLNRHEGSVYSPPAATPMPSEVSPVGAAEQAVREWKGNRLASGRHCCWVGSYRLQAAWRQSAASDDPADEGVRRVSPAMHNESGAPPSTGMVSRQTTALSRKRTPKARNSAGASG